MYIFELSYDNAARNESGGLDFAVGKDALKKWTFIDSTGTEKELELLQLVALASSGCKGYLERLPCDLPGLIGDRSRPLQFELVWAEHIARKGVIFEKPRKQSGMKITPQGKSMPVYSKDKRLLHKAIPKAHFSKWSPPAKHTVFAYGAALQAHAGSDDFDFSDPFYQLRRIHSLFSAQARLTDPVAFLENIHYRGITKGRYMPFQILQDLQRSLWRYLNVDTAGWMERNADFSQLWARLTPGQKLLILPVLDAARHLHDALPSYGNPLHFPGIMLLYRPDHYCSSQYFVDWINLLDGLFPAMQFVVAVLPPFKDLLLESLLCKKLHRFTAYHQSYPGTRAALPRPAEVLPARTMLLVDVDSRLPNLALMKLAGYYKQQGYYIKLAKKEAYEPGAEAVFASSVFNTPHSKRRIQKMQAYYGDVFHCGGSGIDIEKRLPPEIEEAEPDYGLYPELQDRSIGFLTRGCPFNCPFCIVPRKEGKPRQVSDLDALTGPHKKKLILLDDNILAHPNSHELLQAMASKNLQVNFNQTLDINLVDKEKAELIRAINCSNVKFTRRMYHFSLNDTCDLPELRQKYALFRFEPRDNVEFICMYGFNTTLVQDLERFRFLRSLPGAYVFVQEYQPIAGSPKPRLDDYFPDQFLSDRYIDELIGICFPQNMKSMEKFYRWLSKLYAERFGTLHMGLVDTIFRYNGRFNRGRYIASLAGTQDID